VKFQIRKIGGIWYVLDGPTGMMRREWRNFNDALLFVKVFCQMWRNTHAL
jgi:glucan-binding YG repeat protein